MGRIKRDNLYQHLIEKQFNIVEKVTLDAFIEDWREWSISKKQSEEFKKYFISLVKKTLKCSKPKALLAYNRFIVTHGLKIK